MPETDAELLAAALAAATAGDRMRFAATFGYAPAQLSRWLAGLRPLPRDVRRTCAAILADPERVTAAYSAT